MLWEYVLSLGGDQNFSHGLLKGGPERFDNRPSQTAAPLPVKNDNSLITLLHSHFIVVIIVVTKYMI